MPLGIAFWSLVIVLRASALISYFRCLMSLLTAFRPLVIVFSLLGVVFRSLVIVGGAGLVFNIVHCRFIRICLLIDFIYLLVVYYPLLVVHDDDDHY